MYSFSFCFLLAYPHPLLRLVNSFSFDFILALDLGAPWVGIYLSSHKRSSRGISFLAHTTLRSFTCWLWDIELLLSGKTFSNLVKSHGSSCSHDILSIPPHPLFLITALLARLRFAGLRICSRRCSLSNGTSTMLSSHIHMKVCTPPIPFGFRPISLGTAINLGWDLLG